MNVIAYLNGEPQITDQSPCVCVTIRPIAIFLNDFANDEQRQRLLPFVLRAMGTATDDIAVMSARLSAVVRYAEFNAHLAAESTKYAASCVKFAVLYAKYVFESANYAALCAESAAKYAKYAANCAEYVVKSADSTTYEARREAIFQAGLDFLEEVCPPAEPVNQTIIARANNLLELAEQEWGAA